MRLLYSFIFISIHSIVVSHTCVGASKASTISCIHANNATYVYNLQLGATFSMGSMVQLRPGSVKKYLLANSSTKHKLFAARQRLRGFYQDGFFQSLLVAILMVLVICIYATNVQASSPYKPLSKKLKLMHQVCHNLSRKKPVLINNARFLFGRLEYRQRAVTQLGPGESIDTHIVGI